MILSSLTRNTMAIVTLSTALLLGGTLAQGAEGTNVTPELRQQFVEALKGDTAKLSASIAQGRAAIQSKPNDARMLVWLGAVLTRESGARFQAQDYQNGQAMWTEGLEKMNAAVTVAPYDYEVRAVRGITLRTLVQYAPAQMTKGFAAQAREDLIAAATAAAASGELRQTTLFGTVLAYLAESEQELGNHAAAKTAMETLVAQAPASSYAAGAKDWLAKGDPRQPIQITER